MLRLSIVYPVALAALVVASTLGAPAHAGQAADDHALPPPTRRVLRPGRSVGALEPKPVVARVRPETLQVGLAAPRVTTRASATAGSRATPVAAEAAPRRATPRRASPSRTLVPSRSPERPTAPAAPEPRSAVVAAPPAPAMPLGQALHLLSSRDFHARMRGSRALVAAGATALPLLGQAGELHVQGPGGLRVSATRGAIEAVLESLDSSTLAQHLAGPHRTVRRAAAAELGRRKSPEAVDHLIACLGDSCPCVRAAAITSLRGTTARFFGYDAEASPAARLASVRRWRHWRMALARIDARHVDQPATR